MDTQIDVKALRMALGWTQAQLGSELGVDQSTVSHWEAGGSPRGPALKLLQSLRLQADRSTDAQGEGTSVMEAAE